MAQDEPSAGPAWQKFNLTLADGTRTEIAGPFYYREESEGQSTEAWPPFYSHYSDTNVAAVEDDFLFPLLSREAYGREYRWQLAQLFSFAGGGVADGGDARRFTLYPLYFQQRSADTNLDYTAVVPFYGHIKNRLMLNDVYFIMFPLYSETRKHDMVTDNYLYPFFSLRRGDHLRGWKFWPLMGREHKDITSATNGFGDVSLVPGHDNLFVLAPFYYHNSTDLGTDDPKKFLAVFPFYVQSRSPQRDSTSVIWPFFTWIDDRERKYHEWQGPWPFVIFTRGEGKHTSRVFPIFSQSRDSRFESDSYLWPLYQYHGYHTELLEQKKTRMMFYLYENTVEKNVTTGAQKHRVDMWPFFSWQKDTVGNERLQVFSPLESVLPGQRGIERNWSPLWAVWRAEDNATNGHRSRSLLWNLYRSETTPVAKNTSLLFGLFQYKYDGATEKLRLFYFPAFNVHKQVKWSGK